jgi:hypothetical protein
MILSNTQILAFTRKQYPMDSFNITDIYTIMKEVERLTREETRDAICNKLDDFLHPFIYGDKG